MEREKPDAILPTMGGQTALNAAMELNRNGALARHNVKLIGANAQAIAKGEDRQLFKEAMLRIGLDVPRSGVAHSAGGCRVTSPMPSVRFRSSSGPPSLSAAPAAASPTIAKSWRR